MIRQFSQGAFRRSCRFPISYLGASELISSAVSGIVFDFTKLLSHGYTFANVQVAIVNAPERVGSWE